MKQTPTSLILTKVSNYYFDFNSLLFNTVFLYTFSFCLSQRDAKQTEAVARTELKPDIVSTNEQFTTVYPKSIISEKQWLEYHRSIWHPQEEQPFNKYDIPSFTDQQLEDFNKAFSPVYRKKSRAEDHTTFGCEPHHGGRPVVAISTAEIEAQWAMAYYIRVNEWGDRVEICFLK